MSWRLHRIGIALVRFVMPSSILIVGLLLLIVALERVQSAEAGDWWPILVQGVGLMLGSVVLLIVTNTRRARRRWRSLLEPGDPRDDAR